MSQRCKKTFEVCRDLLCSTHGIGPLGNQRYVGLRRPGESEEEAVKRLYEEAMKVSTSAPAELVS